MRKEQLVKTELVESQSGLSKFLTQENNIFIYDVQHGWGYNHNILAGQKDQMYFNKKVLLILIAIT